MLTEDQLKVFTLIKEKITLNSKGVIFQLSGPGGVGKTFIIKYLIDHYKPENIQICSPTHKACKVLRDKIQNIKSFRLITTCHQYFNATSYYNKDGKQVWKFRKPSKKAKIIIIDEVSMIDKNLYFQFKKLLDTGVNIITMGDNCQLPPVEQHWEQNKEENQETPFYKNHKIDYILTKNIRNDDCEYNQLLNQVRQMIQNSNEEKITTNSLLNLLKKYLQIYDIQFKKIDTSIIGEDIFKEYTEMIKNNKTPCMLSYRTGKQNTVYELNQRIRSYIFPNSEEQYNSGEKIIFTGFYKKQVGISVNEDGDKKEEFITYYTSDEDVINKVSLGKVKFYDEVFCVYRLYLNSMEEYKCMFEDEIKFDSKLFVTTLHDSETRRFNLYSKKIRDHIKFKVKQEKDNCSVSSECKQLKDECSHNKKINELWEEYNMNYNIIKCPIDYSYALSIHKSQGSSFDEVFVCLSDFLWLLYSSEEKTQQILFLKLLYVALSRSRNTAVIF